jgi:predicted Zn-dependent protease
MTRRTFLWTTSASAAAFLAGCAANPVTGEKQLMLLSEKDEINIDKEYAPQQFSADYGRVQDDSLNNYIRQTGMQMAKRTHRPQMPYNFRAVNATYINAYAFPGGSIACTRGILLSMESEAELAALLGHELGHVNHRHTAQRMTQGQITNLVVGGLTAVVEANYEKYAWAAQGLGAIGAGLLLAKYSRDDEREADATGMEYMVRSGYTPQGMVGLMDMLRSMSNHKPNAIETMFSTHPMSSERYKTAMQRARTEYKSAAGKPLYKERYMDNTAQLRAQKGAIEAMQQGESLMNQKKPQEAGEYFRKAMKLAPNDYTAHVLMAKCELYQDNHHEAVAYANQAKRIYPREAQAHHISGYAYLQAKNYSSANKEFNRYQELMPGNPNTVFLKGYTQEQMGNLNAAAVNYKKYLQQVTQGEQAQYAYNRLVDWGRVKPR